MYVHLLSRLRPGVPALRVRGHIGEAKESVQCDFGKRSIGACSVTRARTGPAQGRSRQGDPEEIDPAGSRVKVGKNTITVVLRKVKGQYGADHWMDLVAKRTTGGATQEDPSAGLMDMMKQIYYFTFPSCVFSFFFLCAFYKRHLDYIDATASKADSTPACLSGKFRRAASRPSTRGAEIIARTLPRTRCMRGTTRMPSAGLQHGGAMRVLASHPTQ